MIQVKRLPKSMNCLVGYSRRIASSNGKETLMIPSFALIHPIALVRRWSPSAPSWIWSAMERAEEQNVIVCLDTGSGKTLVSVLLLEHMRDQELQLRRRRVSLFLVNLVPLVHQQAEVIASNSSLQVGKLYGELKDDPKLKIDTWRLPEWKALLGSHQVIVATARCLLDALIHGYVRMRDINLLVFDKVHHAKKSHPFARIMGYYRHVGKSERPKVFGMTASPMKTGSNASFEDSSDELAKMMEAEISTATRSVQPELISVVNRLNEMAVQYNRLPESELGPGMTELTRRVLEACQGMERFKPILVKIKQILVKIKNIHPGHDQA